MKTDAVKFVMTFVREHTGEFIWKSAIAYDAKAARQLLKHDADVDVLDVRPPTRLPGRSDEIQVLAMAPERQLNSILKASGKDGVMRRPFFAPMPTD